MMNSLYFSHNRFIAKSFFLATILFMMSGVQASDSARKSMMSKLNKFRKKTGKQELICSPDKEKGTVSPTEVVDQLQSGMLLRFKPGKYPPELKLKFHDLKNIIIEGEKVFLGSWVGLNFINCKNVLVRSLTGHFGISISDGTSLTVIDSNLHGLGGWGKNTEITVYNSVLAHVGVHWQLKFQAKFCNIRQIRAGEDRKATFENCLIVENAGFNRISKKDPNKVCFRFKTGSKPKMELKDSLIFTSGKYGVWVNEDEMWEDRQISTSKKVSSLKQLKKVVRIRNCLTNKKPEFTDAEKFDFQLKEDSPGVGWGANVDENGIPQ